jgi:hypothetical protein
MTTPDAPVAVMDARLTRYADAARLPDLGRRP